MGLSLVVHERGTSLVKDLCKHHRDRFSGKHIAQVLKRRPKSRKFSTWMEVRYYSAKIGGFDSRFSLAVRVKDLRRGYESLPSTPPLTTTPRPLLLHLTKFVQSKSLKRAMGFNGYVLSVSTEVPETAKSRTVHFHSQLLGHPLVVSIPRDSR